ncbi:MAG TPA: ArgE/DapE family deacylase [Candidatus Dormibacteraeota bacterium]|jgi:acetylornithine deacetylase|nr:ArgE/DapE family deacylase [Candidatus Dormibacteraeota bacterium]
MGLSSDLEKLVCELVAIESVNPDLVAAGSGETKLAAFVAQWLRAEGLAVQLAEPVAGRPSVIGVLAGSGGGASLMLNAHMDTVGAGGMKDPFAPMVRDGRIYGRGAYDMKGSLAAIMIAAREAKKLKLHGDVIVAAVADEEVASIGTSAVLKRIEADAAIVTEPTELKLCLAHKGFAWLEVETRGVAAHGSRPDLGVDAVAHMGRILTGVLELDQRLRAGRAHLLLGTGTVHASLIEGGQELSTYPARCVVTLERRTVPGENGATALNEIEHLIAKARKEDPALEATVRLTLERPSSQLGADSFVTEAVERAAVEVLKHQPEVIGVAYWMDMALSNAVGIPTVAFGPSGEGAHADVEWVDLASLETCVQVYLGAAERICGNPLG